MPKGTSGLATCEAPGCERNAHAEGLCAKHSWRLRRHGDVELPAKEWTIVLGEDGQPLCSVDGCGRRARGRGMCTLHYQRWKAHESVELPARQPVPIPHGTLHGYRYHNCRCDECMARKRQYHRGVMLMKKYGVSADDYDQMLAEQGGVCALCGCAEIAIDRRYNTPMAMPVDHDHVTGKVRAILCGSCNRGIGQLKESPDLLRAAADYIERYRSA